MRFPRSSGVLLHPTSLPNRHGIGDLGQPAYEFLDFLTDTKQYLWQVLPLGPTGYGDSPYQCFSAFAGNPLLISLDELVAMGLLEPEDVVPEPHDRHRIDYGQVIGYKTYRLHKSHRNFITRQIENVDYAQFCEDNAAWLDDYALFMALKHERGGGSWTEWPLEEIQRQPQAMHAARQRLANDIDYHKFTQWLFFRQWEALRAAANERGIQIVGDIPIFVAHDSADAWANPDLFFLGQDGKPTVVAGVPPDYFSATGQRWGNPLYRWDVMQERGFEWWLSRIRATLKLVDIIRIDHFRGFEAYWEIPAEEPTAVKGQWVKSPGAALFETIQHALGQLPFIAENLGVITDEVEALREQFNLPGMKVLQFAFGNGPDNPFLPHNYDANQVVYTGTHDNETTVGWFTRTDTTGTTDDPEVVLQERDYARQYTPIIDDSEAHWDLIRLAWQSVAVISLVPMQDLLGLDNDARMNFPSSERGNWQWRMTFDQFTDEIKQRLLSLTETYGRVVPTDDNNTSNSDNHK